MKLQLSSDKLYVCFLVARLVSSIPLVPQSTTQFPPLPFPADEDISSCQFIPTTKSPTQPWHDASFEPTDDDNLGAGLANQSLPLLPSSDQALAPAAIAVTRKRDARTTAASNTTTNAVLCTTIAAFTFNSLLLPPPPNTYKTRPRLTLDPGSYVLSFTNSKSVSRVAVDTAIDGHHSAISIRAFDNVASGTVIFSLRQTVEVRFHFLWAPAASQAIRDRVTSGEVALFRIGPG
ncbi:MAG: hypothetical protein OHK93_002489 [Ramalina farinacea]|uniref:Uncharacterized protein n=1 Tax=Ramalina farinacea TaxID=258253 RepID=A0AA43TYS9_9LECA|nr:hypothetical protein [Ramalina farinacea]